MYDIIGDVHGHYSLLKKLLTKMDYRKVNGVFTHPDRKLIFVGDFINRGPEIRKTIKTIRAISESGNGYAILGNHELNAIIFHLKDKNGLPLVQKPGKFFLSLFKTNNEFSKLSEEWIGHLRWLRTLPLSLDFGKIRVVHACWNDAAIKNVESIRENGIIQKKYFRMIHKKPELQITRDFWLLTKGLNFKIPSDIRIKNNKGVWSRSYRLRWWEEPAGKTFEEMSFDSKFRFPQYSIPAEILPVTNPYGAELPIVFFGHYCRSRGPHIVKSNVCCVDSCVTGTQKLMAYRWNGESELKAENLISVKI